MSCRAQSKHLKPQIERFFFYSDEHAPIHMHVVKGDDDAKISLEPSIEVVYNHGLKAKDLKRAIKNPSEERVQEIKDALHAIGSMLVAV